MNSNIIFIFLLLSLYIKKPSFNLTKFTHSQYFFILFFPNFWKDSDFRSIVYIFVTVSVKYPGNDWNILSVKWMYVNNSNFDL